MVRRLVEQQETGPSKQQPRERDAHLPSAREGIRRLFEVSLRESQTAKHGGDLQVDAVAVVAPERLLQIRIAREHRFVLALGRVVVAEPFLERGDLVADVEERLERHCRFFAQGPSAVIESVLREVANRQTRGLHDRPAIDFFEARQHAEQRRLACAIGPAEADALAVVDLPRHAVEQRAIPEGLRQRRELDHGVGWLPESSSVCKPLSAADFRVAPDGSARHR